MWRTLRDILFVSIVLSQGSPVISVLSMARLYDLCGHILLCPDFCGIRRGNRTFAVTIQPAVHCFRSMGMVY